MENNNSLTNHSVAEKENIPHENQNGQKNWLILFLSIALIVAIGIATFFAYQNFQLVNQMAIKITQTQAPVISTPTITPTEKPAKIHTNKFTHNKLTIGYPDGWTIQDGQTTENFPLLKRLVSTVSSNKVVSLAKDNIHIIMIIENLTSGKSDGIFVDDQEYMKYIEDKNIVRIGNADFYLSKTHHAISDLEKAHSGPYTWSSMVEYIPEYKTQDGAIYKGYSNLVKRNGITYNFIIAGDTQEETNPAIQLEIISILESISW